MFSFREFLNNNRFKNGAFIELKFNKDTLNNIKQYFKNNHILNEVPLSEIHSTLLYSRKGITDYIPTNKLKGEKLIVKQLHIWPTQENTNCLVCELYNTNIIKHHNMLIKYHNASHDYPEFIPHVTLSYDCGDLNLDDIELPDFDFVVENECLNSLQENWLKNNLKK